MPRTQERPCRWPGCATMVPAHMWACKPHWSRLPKEYRDAIWQNYRPGQEIDGGLTTGYIAADRAAREWIAANRRPSPSSPSSDDAPGPRALTVSQPFAWLIAAGYKPIENRTWPTRYRGPVYIHAGRGEQYRERFPALREIVYRDIPVPEWDALHKGAIVAVAELIDCRTLGATVPELDAAGRRWAEGPYCWSLANVRALDRPVKCHGTQGLWTPMEPLVRTVERDLADAGRLFA